MRQSPDFFQQLREFEHMRQRVGKAKSARRRDAVGYQLNPCLEVAEFRWNVVEYRLGQEQGRAVDPKQKAQWGMVWKHPATGCVQAAVADAAALLALKLVAENVSVPRRRRQDGLSPLRYNQLLAGGARQGILLAPRSRLRRIGAQFRHPPYNDARYRQSDTFTLQWHITNACELSCRHCYDRTDRAAVSMAQGRKVLRDLKNFCAARRVRGHVCFSGGNPFLHPSFEAFYALATDYGFSVSILTNPVSRQQLARLLAIQPPDYIQVSLEGLAPYNDYMRGNGHFKRTLKFLRLLKTRRVSSAVMLTLSRDNMAQVIPLSEYLRDKADYFTFNRLSTQGEAKNLLLPGKREFAAFLQRYRRAAAGNPIMGYKDNLLNVVLSRRSEPVFGGCTGFGCGAAFNFLAVLADGQAHACRKFPSEIGNVYQNTIAQLYDSVRARRYRAGSRECDACRLRPVCGGCLAAAHSAGLDIFTRRDPFCFARAEGELSTTAHSNRTVCITKEV